MNLLSFLFSAKTIEPDFSTQSSCGRSSNTSISTATAARVYCFLQIRVGAKSQELVGPARPLIKTSGYGLQNLNASVYYTT